MDTRPSTSLLRVLARPLPLIQRVVANIARRSAVDQDLEVSRCEAPESDYVTAHRAETGQVLTYRLPSMASVRPLVTVPRGAVKLLNRC